MNKPENKPVNRTKEIMEWIQAVLIAIIVAFLLRTFVFEFVLVDKTSMLTTLEPGDRLFTERISYQFDVPERGDIIIFKSPINDKEAFVKRAIGLPGEHIVITNGEVYINDVLLDEPYLEQTTGGNIDLIVPDDQFFAMGDNRSGSFDSRDFGTVPLDNLMSRAVFRIFPLSKFGKLD